MPRSLPLAPRAEPARRRLPIADEARPIDRRWQPVYAVWEITIAFTASLALAGCEGGTASIGDGGAADEGGASDGGTSSDGGKDATPTDDGGIQPPYGAPAYGAAPAPDGGA